MAYKLRTSLTKEQFKDWTIALTSGEYKQGFAKLVKSKPVEDRKYCCLGVLGELTGSLEEDGSVKSPEEATGGCLFLEYRTLHKSHVYLLLNYPFQSFLSKLNDSNFTFDQIGEILKTLDSTNLIAFDPPGHTYASEEEYQPWH